MSYISFIQIILLFFMLMHNCSNLKDFVHGHLATKAETSIVRLSRCVGLLMELTQKFDEGLATSKPLPDHHVKPKTAQDIQLVVQKLMSQRAFNVEDGRHHSEFRQFKPLLHKVNDDKIVAWIDKTAKYILHDQ